MVKIKKLSLLATTVAASLFTSAPTLADHSFLVAPGRIEAELKSQTTRTVIVTNTGTDSIRLEIFPEYLAIGNEKGQLNVGESHLSNQAATESLADYITVSPKVLKLKPGQRRDVKVNINGKRSRTNKNAKPIKEDGDYRTHLIVRMKETAATKKVEDPDNDGLSMNLDIKFETAIAIYGRLGEADYSKVKASCNNGIFSLENGSDYKIDGTIKTTKEEIPFVVMRNSTRKAEVKGKVNFLIDEEKFQTLNCN